MAAGGEERRKTTADDGKRRTARERLPDHDSLFSPKGEMTG